MMNSAGEHSTTNTLNVATPNDHEIVMTRAFDAPRHLLFDCWTKPELLKRWLLGPDGWYFVVCDVDLSVGGAFRFVWRGPDGTDMGMGGEFREIVPPERLVNTETYDHDTSGGAALVTVTFTEQAGKTMVTSTMRFPSQETRDAALASGMEDGVAVSYDRLEAYLGSLA